MSNIGKNSFSLKQGNNDSLNDAIKIRIFNLKLTVFSSRQENNDGKYDANKIRYFLIKSQMVK